MSYILSQRVKNTLLFGDGRVGLNGLKPTLEESFSDIFYFNKKVCLNID